MALDPSISLAVKPPTIANPIDSVTKALTLRDLMAQGQLRQQQVLQSQAQTADLQAQQQQRNMDLQDQQTFQKGMQDPATQARVAKGDFSDFEGKMQEKNLDPLRTSRATYLQNLTRQNTEDLTNSQTALTSVAKAINGLKIFRNDDGTLDLNKVNDALPGTLATLSPSLKALKFDSSQLPKTITDESQLDALGGHIGVTLDMHNQAIAMQEAQQKAAAAKSTAETEAAKAIPAQVQSAIATMPDGTDQTALDTWRSGLPKAVQAIAPQTAADIPAFKQRAVPIQEQPKYQTDLVKLAGLQKLSPDDWSKVVDQTTGSDPKYAALNGRTKAAVSQAIRLGDYAKAEAAIKDAGDQVGRVETAANTAGTKVYVAQASQAAKNVANMEDMTQDDINREGQQWAITGVAPNTGMGNAALKSKLIHAKDEFARNSGLNPQELAQAAAAYKGDTRALGTISNTQGMLSQAEQTAGKNLDVFLSKAKNAVDTGSPWINKPLQEVARGGLGSADQAALDTAQGVAVPEIAKVLQQFGAGGSSVLSDTARKEVDTLVSKQSTLKQKYASAAVIRQDMKNRLDSIESVRGHIMDRIGAVPGQTSTAPAFTVPSGAKYQSNPATGKGRYSVDGGKTWVNEP